MTLSLPYLCLTLGLFAVELFLALYVRDDFFRPFVGDMLVVVLIYSAIRTVWDNRTTSLVLGILAFSFTVEFLQKIDIVQILGWEHNTLASVVIGRTFSWPDLAAYTAGCTLILLVRRGFTRKGPEDV